MDDWELCPWGHASARATSLSTEGLVTRQGAFRGRLGGSPAPCALPVSSTASGSAGCVAREEATGLFIC